MDKSVILTLSIGIIAAVIITSVLLTTYMANANSLYSLTDDTGKVQQARKWINSIKGRNCLRSLELSEEFKENVMTIINEDPDVQNLLNEGYEVVKMKPIIKAVIEEDGNVMIKATNVFVILKKETTGRAVVKVDLENMKVSKIIILTKNIIEK